MVCAKKVGAMLTEDDKEALQAAKDAGDTVVDIPDPLNDPTWAGPLKKGTQKYLDSVNQNGVDANAIYEKVQAASKACQV